MTSGPARRAMQGPDEPATEHVVSSITFANGSDSVSVRVGSTGAVSAYSAKSTRSLLGSGGAARAGSGTAFAGDCAERTALASCSSRDACSVATAPTTSTFANSSLCGRANAALAEMDGSKTSAA